MVEDSDFMGFFVFGEFFMEGVNGIELDPYIRVPLLLGFVCLDYSQISGDTPSFRLCLKAQF
ncbi:MAG: hypothetical protein DRP97_00895 [Candidatus Latescibacterota bacterium]|nr:MAG: hypothetical protein DRP97_00895 [Candidatus Latescibacterota bacterium]